MLEFFEFGSRGRLCNQMFEYASLRGIASKHNYEFCLPPSNYNDKWKDHQLFEVFELSGLKYITKNVNFPVVWEKCFHFDEELFENCTDNVSICGLFQTEKYFKHIEKEIKIDFTFKEKILLNCIKYKKNISSNNIISIHIRRQDYVDNPFYEQYGINYYKLALSEFTDMPVIIFSDDINWCKKQDLFNSNKFKFCESGSNAFDLCLMSLCNNHIISNSSFGWWGSWLGEGKTIAPPHWFSSINCSMWAEKDNCYVCGKSMITDVCPKSWSILK